jgi:hypothetical protein
MIRGTAQTLTLSDGYYPVDTNGTHFTGFIPMNIRFSSSIQVDIQKATSPVNIYEATCVVSWALD